MVVWKVATLWPVATLAGLFVNQGRRTRLEKGPTTCALVEGTSVFWVGINPIGFMCAEVLARLLSYVRRGVFFGGCGDGFGCCRFPRLRSVWRGRGQSWERGKLIYTPLYTGEYFLFSLHYAVNGDLYLSLWFSNFVRMHNWASPQREIHLFRGRNPIQPPFWLISNIQTHLKYILD